LQNSVEVQGVTAECLGQAAALFDIRLDFGQQALHRRVRVPATDNVE